MKQLILIRHAKSSWDDPRLTDFERPLNKRGQHDAPRMGKKLAKQGFRLDRLLVSPATRTITTAQMICKGADIKLERIEEIPAIYEASVETLLQLIRGLDEHHRSVALVGHNPGLTMLANRLGDQHIDNIPTCGVVRLQIPDAWEITGSTTLHVDAFLYPKRFK